jgi:hypothetical protein
LAVEPYRAEFQYPGACGGRVFDHDI